jgi:hypothetical protein
MGERTEERSKEKENEKNKYFLLQYKTIAP